MERTYNLYIGAVPLSVISGFFQKFDFFANFWKMTTWYMYFRSLRDFDGVFKNELSAIRRWIWFFIWHLKENSLGVFAILRKKNIFKLESD